MPKTRPNWGLIAFLLLALALDAVVVAAICLAVRS